MRTFGTLPIENALKVQYKGKPAYMKKNSSSKSGQKRSLANEQSEQKLFTLGGFWKKNPAAGERLTIGLDLGDRASCWCALER